MTYWVIARFDKAIYFAVDAKVSHPESSTLAPKSGFLEWADVSEKLFSIEYLSHTGRPIKIGICTSGFGSGTTSVTVAGKQGKATFTITDILSDFRDYLINNQVYLENAKQVLLELDAYLKAKYSEVLYTNDHDKTNLWNFIFANACFGIGMIMGDQIPTIATWDTTQVAEHDSYVDDSFTAAHLQRYSGNNRSYVDRTGKFSPAVALETVSKLTSFFNPQTFLTDIIFHAAKTNTVSNDVTQAADAGKVDFLSISSVNSNQLKAKSHKVVRFADQAQPKTMRLHQMLKEVTAEGVALYQHAKELYQDKKYNKAFDVVMKSLNKFKYCNPASRYPAYVRQLAGLICFGRGVALQDSQQFVHAKKDFLLAKEYFNQALTFCKDNIPKFQLVKKTLLSSVTDCEDQCEAQIAFTEIGIKAADALQKAKKLHKEGIEQINQDKCEEALIKLSQSESYFQEAIAICDTTKWLQAVRSESLAALKKCDEDIQFCQEALAPQLGQQQICVIL